jgi:hypothetical protein
MPNPYPVIWQLADILNTRLDGELTFTDPANQPGGGSGSVDSVTAGDASIAVAGTVANPTVAVAALGITAAKIALLAITDAQVATANKDGASGTPSMRTLGTGAAQATAGNDPRLSDSRDPTGAAGGDLTGTYPNPTLAAAGGGAAGPVGDATHAPIVTVDAKRRVTALSSAAISGVAPAGAAGGDLSGTYPNPATAKLNGVAITNAPVLGQVLTATDATHALWAAGGGGGGEIGYDEITTSVSITGTAEGSATTVITCAAHTFDGTPVMVEFFTALLRTSTAATSQIIVGLYESGTLVNRIMALQNDAASPSGMGAIGGFRFTPSAGSHSYVVMAWTTSTSGAQALVAAGAGGAGNNPPAWVRFTEA